jgi:isochorismate synthase
MMDFLRRTLAAPAAPHEIRVVTLSGPAADPDPVAGSAAREPAVFWHEAGGPLFVGTGAAATLAAVGPDRVAALASAARALWPRVTQVTQDDVVPVPPRVFGGFSFLPGAPTPPWTPFGDATFVLPRFLYVRDDDGARLAVALTGEELRGDAAAIAAEAARFLERLQRGAGAPPPGPASRPNPAERDAWIRAVRSVQERIASGQAEKIVAARTRCVRVPGGFDPAAILRRLAAVPAVARFAFRFGGATFLGAAPERLVSRRGRSIRSEAVAGSVNAAGANGADRLLASGKDRLEHDFVVDAIARGLAPFCERLDHPATPEVRRMGAVLHLRTPFLGRLAGDTSVLELASRLHPTPAVGGTPRDAALDWIGREEPEARGWYSAPVGWFDAAGDGDFVVALRCALLDGETARLYAGAGIVRDSDPEAELAETELKLRTMLDALGVEG